MNRENKHFFKATQTRRKFCYSSRTKFLAKYSSRTAVWTWTHDNQNIFVFVQRA